MIDLTTDFKVTDCITCGVKFGLPRVMYDHAAQYGGHFHCPNGHSQGWDRQDCQTEMDKTRQERDRLKQRQAQLQDEIKAEQRRTAAAKGEVTKLKKRASAGVCPCCNRTFQNLKSHMNNKHPAFVEDQGGKVVPIIKRKQGAENG